MWDRECTWFPSIDIYVRYYCAFKRITVLAALVTRLVAPSSAPSY